VKKLDAIRHQTNGGGSMNDSWQKPDFEEVAVNGECTAYSGAVGRPDDGGGAGRVAAVAPPAAPAGERVRAPGANGR
jgi:hypothetical protein